MRLLAMLSVFFLMSAPAFAQTRTFEGLRFETPERLVEVTGGPRPDRPFLRLRNGERTDPFSEFLEVMAGPAAELAPMMTQDNYAEVALTPATRFCGRHDVLRNSARDVGSARVIDVGYVCYNHSRSPQYSRQVVRAVGVFHNGTFTGFMFVRMWLDRPHADDALTPEEWMSASDAMVASIECLDCAAQ